MNHLLILVFCVCGGFSASIDLYQTGGVGSSHYEQHAQSVDAARRGVSRRLGTSSSSGYVDCATCAGLQQQTTAFDAETLDSGLGVGVGVVGLSGASSNLASSTSSHSSSSNQHLLPLYVSPSIGSSSSSLTSSRQVNSQSAPLFIPVAGGGGSENYEQHFEKRIQSNSAPIVLAPSGGASENYQRHFEQRVQSNSAPLIVAAPSGGGSESYQRYEKRIQTNAAAPVYVAPAGGSESFHHHSQRIMTAGVANPIIVNPSTGSESFHQQSQRISKTSSATPIIVNPVGNSEFNSQYSQNLVKTHQLPLPIYQPSSSSVFSHESQAASNSLTGGGYIPVTTGESNSHLESSSRQHSTSGSLIAPHYSTYGVGGHRTGAHLSTGIEGSSSDLNYYMSEAERLAKMQAQGVHAGGIRTGSTVLDTGLSNGSSLNAVGNNAGRYRAQSWEKSSKWASGTEYGSDGRPKNYNHLSTAEAEQHNIDGKQAGYKAATTTLDDDGKVSTYSIHTP